MSIELRHLRSFVAVAEEGHIGRAARRVFITQPALSRQMQLLERELGLGLLRRTARGIELTDDGRALLARARVAVRAADDVLALGRDAEPSGALALGVALAGPSGRWHDLTSAFVARFPRVALDVRQAMSEQLQRDLLAGQLDAAVALAPARLPGLDYTTLIDERVRAWMLRSHALAGRATLTLADLEGATVRLVPNPGGRPHGFNDAVRALLARAGVTVRFADVAGTHPARGLRERESVGLAPPLDFPDDVVGVPIAPAVTMAYMLVRRAGDPHAAVDALLPFAREWLAADRARRCPEDIDVA